MKKYIEPAIEIERLLTNQTVMLTASDDGEEISIGGPGSGGGGDAKARLSDEELEQVLNQQKNGWDSGLW